MLNVIFRTGLITVSVCVAIGAVPSARSAGARVDFNRSGRQVAETLEPSFTPWTPADYWMFHNVNAISNTFGSTTFKFTRVGHVGTSLTTDWWKEGIVGTNRTAKLINDGITVADGTGGAQIEMRVTGLPTGPHTLLTYHNTWANPATHTFSALNIYVDGVAAITNLPVSNRVTNNADAAFAYLQFEATAGRDVVVLFQADASDPSITDRNVCINGFEIDMPSLTHKGIEPVVVDRRGQAVAAVGRQLADRGTTGPRSPPAAPRQGRLTTIAECLADVRSEVGSFAPVQVTGTVTLVDEDRDLLVLQDDSAAMGVFMPLTNRSLQVGQILSLQGAAVLPYFRSFPDYPDRPSGRAYLSSLEAPTNQGSYYLARMRGYLHPPVTGRYTFWIAADDAAVLWLSPDSEPGNAQRISSVIPGDSTGPGEWDRNPSQRSLEIELRAGDPCYLEIMQMHGTGPDYLAVAWEGPGITRSVMEGRHLTPWGDGVSRDSSHSGLTPATNGMLREYWTNYFARDFSALRTRSPSEAIVRVQNLRLTVLGSGPLPAPRRVMPGESPEAVASFQWAELEGTVGWVASDGDTVHLELAGIPSSVWVHVFNWNGRSTARLENARVRVRGVYEKVHDMRQNISGSMRVPDGRHLTVLAPSESGEPDLDSILISEIEPSNPRMTWGRRISVRGRVDSVKPDESLLLSGNDVFEGFCSADGTNWNRMGKPVEIGMSGSALIGLAVASYQPDDLVTATFDPVVGPGSNWLSTTVGHSREGDYSIDGSAITLRGRGRGIAESSDHCFFLYHPLEGQGEIEARLVRLKSADPRAQAGLMIRESLDRKSFYAAVLFTPEQGTRFQCRKIFGEFPVEFYPQQDQRWLKVVRRKNCVRVRPVEPPDFELDQEVNVVGTLVWEAGAPILTEAFCIPVATDNITPLEVDHVLYGLSIEELLTKAQRPSQQYRRGYLEVARVLGLVTFCDRVRGIHTVYIQDGASGIPLRWADTNLTVSLRVGQWVRVSGRTTVGRSPVTLDTDTVTVMGWGSVPEAAPYSAGHFSSRSRYGQWVEVEGVVRTVGQDGTLNLMAREGMLAAWLGRASLSGLKQYVNAQVRARGVLSPDPGGDPLLLIPSPEFLDIREATPPDPFSIPTFSVAALADLNVEPEQLRRMKVSGVVTCVQPKGLFVQDDSGGASALTIEECAVTPGDQVEVVGFPAGRSSVILSQALVRKTGVGTLPAPVPILPVVTDLKQYAGVLVELEGVVLDQRESREGQRLNLQAGSRVFEAALVPAADEVGRLPAIPVGSRVAVTGVCQINRGDAIQGEQSQTEDALMTSLRIWLRAPADVVVLQRPPWWTWKHSVTVAGLFSCGLLGALIWVRTLRQRVTQRTLELQKATKQLEKEIHTSAVLAERDRLAGEIHDSVEQGLTAIMLQLDAAAKQAHNPEAARRCLGMARSMAGFSRAEVEHAVWDLQSPLLKNTGLGSALSHVASAISSGTSAQVTVNIVGQAHPLSSAIEHHLLRIGQEAITNALKHAQPRTIRVTLEYSELELRLSVEDDGNGFDPAAVLKEDRIGHFGLQGMRARARKINSKLAVSSQPGRGTTIAVIVSLNHETDRQDANKNTLP